MERTGVVAVAAGQYHNVALKNDGRVVAWGQNDFGQTNVPTIAQSGVLAIAAGYGHTVALIGSPLPFTALRGDNGTILTWPTNAPGFTLQSTTDLTAPASWSDVTNSPGLLGAQWAVTNPFASGAQYFRLRKQ